MYEENSKRSKSLLPAEGQHTLCAPDCWADPAPSVPLAYRLGTFENSPCPSESCLLTLCCLIHPRHSLVRRLVNSSHPEPLWQVYPPPPLELALRTRGTLMALYRARICSWSCRSLKGKEDNYPRTGNSPGKHPFSGSPVCQCGGHKRFI